jgi:hypothetical protein
MDFGAEGVHPDEEDDDGDEHYCEECGGTISMEEYREHTNGMYSGCCQMGDQRRRQVKLWRPDVQVLSVLQAKRLIFTDETRTTDENYCGDSYRITRQAAQTIAAWPRLTHIDLHNVHIYALPEVNEDEVEDADDIDELPRPAPFFLSPEVIGVASVGQSKARWSIRWIAHTLGSSRAVAFGYGYESLADELARRDGTLTSARVKKASIIVKTEEDYKQVYADLKALNPAQRGSLDVFVRGARAA